MKAFHPFLVVAVAALVAAAGGVSAHKPDDNPETLARGKTIYERSCVLCHGIRGTGDGPAAFFIAPYSAPRPNDFATGGFKFRSTASGELPTDQDLFRTITNGVPGFMPPFAGLTEEERWTVVAYVKSFYPNFRKEKPQPLPVGFSAVPSSPDSIERGRKVYLLNECYVCHGGDGEGDGPAARAGDLKDGNGMPIAPRDLTNPASYKNGFSPRDIYRTIVTGLDGTPMPSYAGQFAGHEEDIWHLVNYIRSLSGSTSP
jgi:mono/diheme cytochrome c family protein